MNIDFGTANILIVNPKNLVLNYPESDLNDEKLITESKKHHQNILPINTLPQQENGTNLGINADVPPPGMKYKRQKM